MPTYAARINVCAALVLTLLTSFAGRAFAQESQPNDLQSEVLNPAGRECRRARAPSQNGGAAKGAARTSRSLAATARRGRDPVVQLIHQQQLADRSEAVADAGASLTPRRIPRCRWLPRMRLYRRKHPVKDRSARIGIRMALSSGKTPKTRGCRSTV